MTKLIVEKLVVIEKGGAGKMSCWTHITACIHVETFIQSDDILEIVKKYMKRAPKITGSELDAEVFINLSSVEDIWVSHDCNRCPYDDKTKKVKSDGSHCDPPKGYKCKSGSYRTRVIIVVCGDLRDRMKDQTQEEFDKFLEYIKKKYYIRDYSVNIEGDC